MTRSRSRARTGGQPPLIPTWVVTPENLPPGYVYTGGLRTQVNQDGSIGWAPHNLVKHSEALSSSAWQKVSGATHLSDTVASFPSTGMIVLQSVTTDAPVGQTFTVSIELSGSGTISLFGARLGPSTYEDVLVQITLTPTPTRYTLTKTVANAGATGWTIGVTRRAATSDTATEVTMSKAIICYGSAVQPYLVTGATAPRFEPRTADYSDSLPVGPVALFGPERATGAWVTAASYLNSTTGSGSSVTAGIAAGGFSRSALSLGAVTIGKTYRLRLRCVSTTGSNAQAFIREGTNPGAGTTILTSPALGAGSLVDTLFVATTAGANLLVVSSGTDSAFQMADISVREITGYDSAQGPVLGPELLTDPSFDNPGSWTLLQPTSGAVTVSSGLLTLDSTDGTYSLAASSTTVQAGKRYRVSMTVESAYGVGIRLDAGTQGLSRSAPGTYVQDVVAVSSSPIGVVRSGLNTAAQGGVVSAISVREIVGYSRLRPGIKMEPQAINLLPNSADMDAAGWAYGAISRYVSSDSWGPAVPKVNVYTPHATNSTHQINCPQISVSGTVTYSIYIKSGGIKKVALREYVATGGYVAFDLETGRLIATGAGALSGVAVQAGRSGMADWRISITMNFGSTTTVGFALLPLPDSYLSGNPHISWVGGQAWIQCAAPQLEAGSVATSYTPTYGSQVTRLEDALYYPASQITGWLPGQTRTTVVDMTSVYPSPLGILRRVFEYVSADGTSFDYLARNGSNTPAFGNDSAGDGSANYLLDGPVKVAVSTSSAGMRFSSSNGPAILSGSNPGRLAVDRLYIGNRVSGSRAVNGSIYRLDYYPRAANDAQLPRLVAPV
jgi:hypothetical protein